MVEEQAEVVQDNGSVDNISVNDNTCLLIFKW
jgi:hypothetical protein